MVNLGTDYTYYVHSGHAIFRRVCMLRRRRRRRTVSGGSDELYCM